MVISRYKTKKALKDRMVKNDGGKSCAAGIVMNSVVGGGPPLMPTYDYY